MAKFQPIDEGMFNKASARAGKAASPYATEVHFDRRTNKVKLTLNTGLEVSFDPRLAYGLGQASPDDLTGVEVEGAGGAIHFPGLDADFSVARLLEGFLGPLDWARREAKADASRRNGKLGGRPRKVSATAAA
jgi:hypothetical protein